MASVERCVDCGCVSLHIQTLTVRVDDAALELLAELLDEATQQLRGSRDANPPGQTPHLA
jgi:hypothetical protein